MSKRTPAAKRGTKCGHKHTGTVRRWVKRKQMENIDSANRYLDDVETAGSRADLHMKECHLWKVKGDKARAERAMLETTSLKDLIK